MSPSCLYLACVKVLREKNLLVMNESGTLQKFAKKAYKHRSSGNDTISVLAFETFILVRRVTQGRVNQDQVARGACLPDPTNPIPDFGTDYPAALTAC